MTKTEDAKQAIRARIIELLESGPVPEDDLPAAVAIPPEEREAVDRWRAQVRAEAEAMCAEGLIARDAQADPATYTLPEGC